MKVHTVYIENDLRNHSIVQKAMQKNPSPIFIDRYTQIFNRNNQNFRLQKRAPCLIFAKKRNHFLHPIPKGYGIGRSNNYYFSHVLNCPFDCTYCFLQGLYRSAHFVVFVNYEDFQQAIEKQIAFEENITFFSGYDGDSLALESVTGFVEAFLPFFAKHPNVEFEIRTKSIRLLPLLNAQPLPNVVIAYSLNPEKITKQMEDKTPPFSKRLEALKKLQQLGWTVALRFDPILPLGNWQPLYLECFLKTFGTLDRQKIHSVTLGNFRLPKTLFKRMEKICDNSFLPRCQTINASGINKQKALDFCQSVLLQHIPPSRLFIC